MKLKLIGKLFLFDFLITLSVVIVLGLLSISLGATYSLLDVSFLVGGVSLIVAGISNYFIMKKSLEGEIRLRCLIVAYIFVYISLFILLALYSVGSKGWDYPMIGFPFPKLWLWLE